MAQKQANKICRLDDLLSKNQMIYQNLKSRLLDINKSNQKINANISSIRPLYSDSDNLYEESTSKVQSQHNPSKMYQLHSQQIVSPKFQQINNNLFEHTREQTKHQQQPSYSEHIINHKLNSYQDQHAQQVDQEQQHEDKYNRFYKNNHQHSFDEPSKIQSQINSYNQELDHQIAQSYIFVPFNKLFRSPVMAIKKHNQIIIARPSKTRFSVSQSKNIIDGIKHKSNNIITNEQELINTLYDSHHQQQRIGLVGGSQSLKKKLHMDLISYAFTGLTDIIMNKDPVDLVQFSIEHQEVSTNCDPQIIKNTWSFSKNPSENRINLIEISTIMEQIFTVMKRKSNNKKPSHRIRVTNMQILCNNSLLQKLVIMSSNKIQSNFLKTLSLDKIVWCFNPLHKFHLQSISTFQEMKKFQKQKTQQRNALNKLPIFDYQNRSEFNDSCSKRFSKCSQIPTTRRY